MILVTGATGFVGRHLVALCAERGERRVFGVGRTAPEDMPGLTSYEQLDLLDAAAVRALVARIAPERVFHLAADASVAASWRAPTSVIDNNVRSTLTLLEAIREEAPDATVLVAGSGEEYGPPERLPVDETHPLRPQNPYAASKAMVDLMAGFYADGQRLRVIRTRAFNHVGPGQADEYVVSAFARQIAEAEAARPPDGRAVIETGTLEAKRDFSDVRDVVRAYWLLVERGHPGVFNVASGRATAVSDILRGLAEHSPLDLAQRTDPARLRTGEVMEITGSHERLTDATGWQPEIELSDTLRDTLDWWRERVAGEVASR